MRCCQQDWPRMPQNMAWENNQIYRPHMETISTSARPLPKQYWNTPQQVISERCPRDVREMSHGCSSHRQAISDASPFPPAMQHRKCMLFPHRLIDLNFIDSLYEEMYSQRYSQRMSKHLPTTRRGMENMSSRNGRGVAEELPRGCRGVAERQATDVPKTGYNSSIRRPYIANLCHNVGEDPARTRRLLNLHTST